MKASRLERAVRRLLEESRLREAFRRDPAGFGRRFRLTPGELEALKSGDEDVLARHGVDLQRLLAPRRPLWLAGMSTAAGRAAAAALLALAFLAGPGGGRAQAGDLCIVRRCPSPGPGRGRRAAPPQVRTMLTGIRARHMGRVRGRVMGRAMGQALRGHLRAFGRRAFGGGGFDGKAKGLVNLSH